MAEDTHSISDGDKATRGLILRFLEAFNACDVAAIMGMMTEDCVFENTYPPPEGSRYEGQAAVRAFWEEFFLTSRQPTFVVEEVFAAGERATLCWTYHWLEEDGRGGHVRGVDVYRVRDGRVAEKKSYVKG